MPPPPQPQLQRQPAADPHQAARQALLREIALDKSFLKTTVAALQPAYPPDTFKLLGKKMAELSKKYNRFRKRRFESYYDLLNSSQRFKDIVKAVIDSALKASDLFNRYQKDPASYNSVRVEYVLDNVLLHLEDLEQQCKMGN